MSSSDPEATPEFQYPPVQTDRSLTNFDLRTLMSKSTSRRLPEQPSSSLDDSTYELLTDSLIETSDDDAHTASIASTSGEPTPDDVSAFSDDDDDFEGHQRARDEDTQSMHAMHAYDDLETPMAAGPEDSVLTTIPYLESSHDSTNLQLEEDPAENLESALGSTILAGFPTETEPLPKALEVYGRTQVRIAVRAALSSQHMSAPDNYKIVFIGMPEKWWAQDEIIAQLHAALEASSSNTRSVMVRGQMEPLGSVIDARSCTQVDVGITGEAVDDITLRMDNGQRLRLHGRKTPRFDLAILCHTKERQTPTDRQVDESLRTAFRHHQIPLIEMTDIKAYGTGAKTYDMRSLAACVEGRNDDTADFELLEVLPLDAYNFRELDPAQINRHLALISPHLARPVEAVPKTRLSAIGDTLRGVGKQLRTGAPATTKVLLLSIALTMMLSAFVLSPVYMPLVLQKPTDTAVEIPTMAVVPASSSLVTTPALSSSSAAAPLTLSSLSKSISNGLTVIPTSVESKPRQAEKENIGGFEIQTAGENQFVLTPSKEVASLRKKPQLSIQVMRNTTIVPIRYVRTITGEYFVDLEQDYSFGMFNVSITSYSKPHVRQSFAVNLGHNKTWIDQVLGTTTKKAMSARSALLSISSAAAAQIQTKLSNVTVPKFGQWVDGYQLQTAYDAAKGSLETKAEVGADLVKRVPEAAWTGLRKATAPVRLSQTLWKARVNALRVRCHVEAASQSLLGVTGKQPSRACSELHSHTQE